jgi:hypothetical protein
MTKSAAPMHDTKNPLSCCPRCYKAELLGRAMKYPLFRYEKVESADQPSMYLVFHGEHHVATLHRGRTPGPTSYGVRVEWDADAEELRAGSLRDARALAEGAYTETWRAGRYPMRGPVRDLV